MSKHNQNYKANRLRKICITSMERHGFAITGKNAVMERKFGLHKAGLLEAKECQFEYG